MRRSKLKNIISKSKTVTKPEVVGEPFDEFKKTLPIEVNDNYRLEAAWKAYGSPKNFNEALWEGMIQPIDENNYKLPSIGYNEETDEYEYLNKGEDNEIVAKDIRVWDNDVIPLVKELKLGGYIRTYNKEKDCWTYTKNSQKKEQPVEEEQVIEEFKNGGQMNVIPEGALHARKNNMEGAGEDFTAKGIPVVTTDSKEEQVAEIERNEIIFCKEVTDKIEEAFKEYNSEETSASKKDELAIKIGKFLTKEIIENTQDNTGLIEEVANKN